MLQKPNLAAEPSLRMQGVQDLHDDADAIDGALLTLADPCHDSRISLIGPNTLEMLCVLLRHGNTSVSAVRISDWPRHGTADVAIIPSIAVPDTLSRAVAHARRILSPLGTLAMHVQSDPADAPALRARQLLLLHGFSAILVRDFAGDTLIRAEVPLFGRIECA